MIDSTSFQRKKTGIEYYGYEVSKNLYNIGNNSENIMYFLFDKEEPDWFVEKNNIKSKVYKGNSKFYMEQFWLPMMLLQFKVDSIYFPVFPPSILMIILKFILGIKVYRTIFDAIMWKMSDTTSFKNKLYMKPLETLGASYYDKVFTISEFSKKDIIDVFPRLNHKVINASIGMKDTGEFIYTPSDVIDVLSSYHISAKKYILFVGTIDPRKNIDFLIDILDDIIKKKRTIKLVLAGRKGWGHEKLVKHPLYNKLKNYIVETDYIKDKDLFILYDHALAFIFPSKYEGFGLPIVEAMALGCPTISANNSSIPEAVDNSGILIKGWNIDKWSDTIIDLSMNVDAQDKLIKKGLERVQKLSWPKTSNIIYKEIING